MLRARGATVLDADEVARDVVAPGKPAVREIEEHFGDAVLTAEGRIDRQALGERVFSDPEARARLNEITHPRIYEALAERVAALGEGAGVIVEAALLAETYSRAAERLGMQDLIVVDCPEEQQIARLAAGRLMSPEAARQRLRAQMSRDDRLARAGYIIDNSGSLAELEIEVDRVWAALIGAAPA